MAVTRNLVSCANELMRQNTVFNNPQRMLPAVDETGSSCGHVKSRTMTSLEGKGAADNDERDGVLQPACWSGLSNSCDCCTVEVHALKGAFRATRQVVCPNKKRANRFQLIPNAYPSSTILFCPLPLSTYVYEESDSFADIFRQWEKERKQPPTPERRRSAIPNAQTPPSTEEGQRKRAIR
ncbi:hypothetical protein ZHAS_00016193 [Anopheles sinensis]|uniref:Uncharacterized protein n=1 Tax=Anopheles sinensis TaxID=74873 RepID=A0A084WD37_ANOSI|nr:hypothetical protein ZHAS_00016193 [Anopheles sinensis]